MNTIHITTETNETFSSVSNFFIDYYMTDANGEYVKVYLYLTRLLTANRTVHIADIANHFGRTNADICRALKYWIKQDVLRLDYDDNGDLSGIVLLPLRNQSATSDEEDLALLSKRKVTKAVVTEPTESTAKENASDISAVQESAAALASVPVPKRTTYSTSEITAKSADHDFSQIVYVTEMMFERPVTPANLQILLYIYDELHFSADLLEYLIEFCATINKKSLRYAESVAIDWYQSGIRTVDEAKERAVDYNSIYTAVLKQLGISRRVPTSIETGYINTWYQEYAFDESIIIEACKRAVTSRPQNVTFSYVNGILENWHKQNVKHLSDIEALDHEWLEKKKRQAQQKVVSNQFNQFQQRETTKEMEEFDDLLMREVQLTSKKQA